MKIKLNLLYIFLILVLSLTLVSCEGRDYEDITSSVEEAMDVYGSSQYLHFTGNFSHINASTKVIADEKIVGSIKESGLFNVRYTFSVGKDDQFYVSLYDGDKADDDRYSSSTTYAYYDSNDEMIGFAQKRKVFEDGRYVMTFLDHRRRMKSCYVEPNDNWTENWAESGATIYNMDRDPIGSIEIKRAFIFSDSYTVDVDLGEAAADLSGEDRTAIYYQAVNDANDRFGD